MTDRWTVGQVLTWTIERFEKAEIESARLEAQVLLSHVLGCERIALYASYERPLTMEERQQLRGLISRRLEGEPLAYLVGSKEFWSVRLDVDPRVLIPRGDTETLVEKVLDSKPKEAACILELGTGSGAIVIALAKEKPLCAFTATDISEDALELAKNNAEKNGVANVTFLRGDLFEALPEPRQFVAIAANLPYIKSGDIGSLAPEVQKEPHLALDGGADGLGPIRKVIEQSHDFLAPGGALFLEHGNTQGPDVCELMSQSGLDPVTFPDLGGNPRVTIGTSSSTSSGPLPSE